MPTAETPTALLVRSGWTRNAQSDYRQSCGQPGPTSGYCARNARWSRPGNGAMCAQHAAEVTRRTSPAARPAR